VFIYRNIVNKRKKRKPDGLNMNILITGIGGPTPLGIAKSILLSDNFKNVKLVGVDSDRYAPGLYNKELFNKTYLIPHSSSDDYWSFLKSIISKESIEHAFVVPELEVLEWSSKMKTGRLPCNSLLPDYEVAKVLYDKYELYNRLNDSALVPKTVKVEVSSVEKNICDIQGVPFWVRARSGAGAMGSLKINTMDDLRIWIKLNPHINDFIASEYLPGKIYACKILFYEGKAIRAACAERIDYLMAHSSPSGISGMCARGQLINKREIVDASIRALNILFESCGQNPHGMFTVDYREDKVGVPKITEINIRHVSFTLAFSLCGANFAQDTLMLCTGNPAFDRSFKIYEFDDDYTFIRGVDARLRVLKNSDIQSFKL
jgi:predicted ATP-grasp superfamily ATP-dependent carboligase